MSFNKNEHNFNIKVCQTLVRTGDLEGNFKQVIDEVNKMAEEEVEILVFPETALTGYCCGALWENTEFVVKQKQLLFDISVSLPFNRAVVIGFVNYLGQDADGYPILTNSAAVINNGHIGIYDKQLLASRDHHEDVKYFRAGTETKTFELTLWHGKIIIGVPICEDIWYKNHTRNIPQEMIHQGAELLITLNQSYFHYDKYKERIDMVSELCTKIRKPLIYVNAVGVGDIVKNVMIFDGGSFVVDSFGRVQDHLGRFGPESRKIHTDDILYADDPKEDLPSDAFDKYIQISEAIIFAQREIFELSHIKKAQVHLSGGIDSAVVAALSVCAETGGETIFITNPSVENSVETKNHAMHVATKLCRPLYWEFIDDAVGALSDAHRFAFKKDPISNGALTCAHAVGRTVLGLMATHEFGTGIVPTANHTEIVLGWANFHDIGSIGVYAPIGDLTKTEIFELAEFINLRAGNEIIPKQLYNGDLMPAAELPDAKFDPINYFLQSGICANMIRLRMSKSQQMDAFQNKTLRLEYFKPLRVYGLDPENVKAVYDVHPDEFETALDYAYSKARISVYKAAQGAPILILSPRSRGFSNRETLFNLYKE